MLFFYTLISTTILAATPAWEVENPIVPIPASPRGLEGQLKDLQDPPTPERVRLGRWLFFDKRLSKDGTISCASCHRPENAFSEPTPHSTGIHGQKGNRKAPTFLNAAFSFVPNFFWDGRAKSLEDQALGPIQNPIEMGSSLEATISICNKSYRRYFKEAFGTEEITKERVAKAIADYERTRLSGNSAWDRWKAGDEKAVSDDVKKGDALFFEKAACNQCHFGPTFADSLFHNLGVGWDPKKKAFADVGRSKISNNPEDEGAFKTPTLRDVTKHAPYMHDGSMKTLTEVVQHYNKGGNKNPRLSPKMKPLKLTKLEVKQLVKLMEALDGEGYSDKAPTSFPE